MNSSLRERLERLGPVRAIDRVPCGTPGTFQVRRERHDPELNRIDAVLVLTRRGLGLLDAKQRIEQAIETGQATVLLPSVENQAAVDAELAAAGFSATRIKPRRNVHVRSARTRHEKVDVRALRKRLGLTQVQFARRYGLSVKTVWNWETGRAEPDETARTLLRVIASAPEQVAAVVAV